MWRHLPTDTIAPLAMPMSTTISAFEPSTSIVTTAQISFSINSQGGHFGVFEAFLKFWLF